jgi:hypothetical protein
MGVVLRLANIGCTVLRCHTCSVRRCVQHAMTGNALNQSDAAGAQFRQPLTEGVCAAGTMAACLVFHAWLVRQCTALCHAEDAVLLHLGCRLAVQGHRAAPGVPRNVGPYSWCAQRCVLQCTALRALVATGPPVLCSQRDLDLRDRASCEHVHDWQPRIPGLAAWTMCRSCCCRGQPLTQALFRKSCCIVDLGLTHVP